MSTRLSDRVSNIRKGFVISLCLVVILGGCGTSSVQLRAPYYEKIRTGDGVKVTTEDGVIHSGRVVYLDRNVVVIRTPKQIIVENPVQTSKFGTTIPWETVKVVKVAGILDSQKKLISNEEIRINKRTNKRKIMGINMGLLGATISFLAGVRIQDQVSPASTDLTTDNHGRARIAFWTTFVGGTIASVLGGYKMGDQIDRHNSVARIERLRANLRRVCQVFCVNGLSMLMALFPRT